MLAQGADGICLHEAHTFEYYNGFDTVSVACKAGAVPKSDLGLMACDQVDPGATHESMCNPVFQAEALNASRTDFNVLLGLCVGHDSLFIKYAEAPCTVLAVKDRLLGSPVSDVDVVFAPGREGIRQGLWRSGEDRRFFLGRGIREGQLNGPAERRAASSPPRRGKGESGLLLRPARSHRRRARGEGDWNWSAAPPR